MIVAACTIVAAGAHAHASNSSPCWVQPRPQDDVWLVSCRGLGCLSPGQTDRLGYWRYDREKGWLRATLEELKATDSPEQVTTVFLHGNRIIFTEAFTKGWIAYRTLVSCAPERPVRFIIWSWPSEPFRGFIQDARIKAGRTDVCAYYLAWFLDQLEPDVPVSLWAHSFGARIATGALNLLGGGTSGGHRLDRLHSTRQPIASALLVSAIDCDWLFPGHRHGYALSQTSAMLLVNNCCDILLKRYRLLYCRRSCASAVGFMGLATGYLAPADRAKVSQIDACGYVGRRHQFAGYLCSPELMARIRSVLLFEPLAHNGSPPHVVADADADAAIP